MIIREAAAQVLNTLDFEDEEEYTQANAEFHVNQAIYEINEGNEFTISNQLSTISLVSPEEGSEPSYWTEIPGRAPLIQLLGTSWSNFGYIKQAWLSDGVGQVPFKQRDLRELLDEYGDDSGQPEKYSLSGEYIYWRPIPVAGESYEARLLWHQMPSFGSPNDEPMLLAQAPFGVIYYACMLACIWSGDDNRIKIFGDMSQRAFEMYNNRSSMNNDGPRFMEDFNG